MKNLFSTLMFKPLILLLLITSIRSDEKEDIEDISATNPIRAFRNQLKSRKPICTEGLANAYGMNGFSQDMKLARRGWYYCPDITHTCCTEEDADSGFQALQGGLKNLKQHFSIYREILDNLFEKLSEAREIANRVNTRSAKVRFSNCKVLASKVILYDINRVSAKILEGIDSTYKMLLFSFKGFFCEICNAHKNKFVFNEDGFVVVNKNQCRNIVVGAIKSMYYLHNLMTNYVNLVAKFLNNCDAKGVYYDDVLESHFLLIPSLSTKLIERCWNERNSPKWLEDCKDFCDKFNFVSLSDFIKPYAYKFIMLTHMFQKRNLQMISQETLDASIDDEVHEGSQELLEDLGYKKESSLKYLHAFTDKDFEEAQQQAQIIMSSIKNDNIIYTIQGNGIPIDHNVIVYMDQGLDFYTSGKNTAISTSDDSIDPGRKFSDKDNFEVTRLDSGSSPLATEEKSKPSNKTSDSSGITKGISNEPDRITPVTGQTNKHKRQLKSSATLIRSLVVVLLVGFFYLNYT